MAKNKKNLTPAQIMQLIQATGGDAGDAGLSKKQLLAALLSSPSMLSQMQAEAKQSVSPYAEYDPSFVYNPAEEANPVVYKYMAMGPQFEKLVSDYWSDIQKNPSPNAREAVRVEVMNNPAVYAKKYGIPEEEVLSITKLMTNPDEVSAFSKAEQARQKKQFAAFNAKKVKLGIRGADTATEDYLKATTGLAGLGEIPTEEAYLSARKKKFLASKTGKGYNEAMLYNQGEQLVKKLAAKMKKEKKSVAQLTAADLIKKNLTGL